MHVWHHEYPAQYCWYGKKAEESTNQQKIYLEKKKKDTQSLLYLKKYSLFSLLSVLINQHPHINLVLFVDCIIANLLTHIHINK